MGIAHPINGLDYSNLGAALSGLSLAQLEYQPGRYGWPLSLKAWISGIRLGSLCLNRVSVSGMFSALRTDRYTLNATPSCPGSAAPDRQPSSILMPCTAAIPKPVAERIISYPSRFNGSTR